MQGLKVACWFLLGVVGTGIGQESAPAKPMARISGGVMAGSILTKVNPVYPEEAKAKGISGFVVLHAIIGKDGSIEKLTVISGPEILADAAVEAVSQWKYKPFLLNGEPVEVDTTVTVNFQGSPLSPAGAQLGGVMGGPGPAIAPPPGPVRISGGVMQGLLLSKVDPLYPAGVENLRGAVVLMVIVGEDGAVQSAQAVSGPDPLRASAEKAVRRWRYKPYVLNGRPTSVNTTVTVMFNRP